MNKNVYLKKSIQQNFKANPSSILIRGCLLLKKKKKTDEEKIKKKRR